MKIVLVIEQSKSQPAVEETFFKPLIRIGRDRNNCDIAFDNTEFRMVSRHHADIRFNNGKWMVGDMGSSFGTYLNGTRLERPTEISAGSSIQFGENGPRCHVIWLEAGTAPQEELKTPVPTPRPTPAPTPPKAPDPTSLQNAASPPKQTPAKPAKLVLETGAGSKEFEIAKHGFQIGRDPQSDLVIDASAVMVSRRHAEIRMSGSEYLIHDNQTFNGTLVNEQRISLPTVLSNGDRIQLGLGGPVIAFSDGSSLAKSKSPESRVKLPAQMPTDYSGTMIFNIADAAKQAGKSPGNQRQLLVQTDFDGKTELTIGRDASNDITLDGLQISSRHARLREAGAGITIEDLNSTNGLFVNGERVSKRRLEYGDVVQIGAFVIELDSYGKVCVYDTRSKTRIDAVSISKDVRNRSGGGKLRLLDDISLSINPNEFVGLLGPSGAGKSTFMEALNGMRSPTVGAVYINGIDLHRYIDSLKQSIGFVPQDEIIHGQLTVARTLQYIAKLRLSRDVSKSEIEQIVNEVLDVTGLAERRDVAIDRLSGGQRKRVAIAVELITKPSVIFLDEPTSGLDPATEEKIMLLFRQIAESGRTVILTTHAMENVRLFDKIVILMRGKLVFYGRPEEALKHFGVKSYKALFEKLEEPVDEQVAESGESARAIVTERVAGEWSQKFSVTPYFENYIRKPLTEISGSETSKSKKSVRLGLFGAFRQWMTLSSRYARVLLGDKFNLFVLLIQAPVIAILVFFVMGANQPRDFAYFALSLCSVWFGTSLAAREIVRERKIYERERMVNLGILPYLASKYAVLGIIVAVQCLLLFIPLKFFDLTGLMPMPGLLAGIPQFIAMLLTAGVGISLGLFVSAVVRTSEMATSLVPLILIPQIIFSGLIGVPTGINKVVGLAMPAAWSFDTMKRFSTLDTLEPEGAFRKDGVDGKGLYKSIEERNDDIISEAKENIKDYEKDLEKQLQDAERRARNGELVSFTNLPERPKVGEAVKLPEDLSRYITFLHPWMHEFVNPLVLLFMSFVLFILTVLALRLQDIV